MELNKYKFELSNLKHQTNVFRNIRDELDYQLTKITRRKNEILRFKKLISIKQNENKRNKIEVRNIIIDLQLQQYRDISL